jgi:hypothetical protein
MARRVLTDERRAARQEQQRQLVASSVEQLRSTDGWQRWLRTREAFRRYSMRNTLLIAIQAPEAPASRVPQVAALRYCVRRGETGIYAWAPMPPSKKRLAAWEAPASPRTRSPGPTSG